MFDDPSKSASTGKSKVKLDKKSSYLDARITRSQVKNDAIHEDSKEIKTTQTHNRLTSEDSCLQLRHISGKEFEKINELEGDKVERFKQL